MELKKIYEPIKKELEEVESLIWEIAENSPSLREELKTIFSAKGKRIRPAVLLLISKHYGVKGGSPIPLAVAIELLHTASLIHDDLVDNANLRRGKPSFHKFWGPDLTVLLGDYLYVKAIHLVLKNVNPYIIRALSKSASKMVEGEIEEIKRRGDLNLKITDYFSILEKKTASLFSASAEIGGLLGNAPEAELKALKNFGISIGISFQLIDDLLDIISTEDELGKPTLSDLKEKKTTLPLLYLLMRNENNVREKIKWVFEDGDFLRVKKEEIIELVLNNGAKDFTLSKAEHFTKKAIEALKILKPSPFVDSLNDLANYIVSRRW